MISHFIKCFPPQNSGYFGGGGGGKWDNDLVRGQSDGLGLGYLAPRRLEKRKSHDIDNLQAIDLVKAVLGRPSYKALGSLKKLN